MIHICNPSQFRDGFFLYILYYQVKNKINQKGVDKYPHRVYNTTRGDNVKDFKECECCKKTKERSHDEYRKLINRLNRIEGQIRGIKGMVENNAYCTDILIQVSAVNSALNSFNKELLANHIRTCVADDIRNGKDEVIDELVDTLQKLMK